VTILAMIYLLPKCKAPFEVFVGGRVIVVLGNNKKRNHNYKNNKHFIVITLSARNK
jgi:hypothetical protein